MALEHEALTERIIGAAIEVHRRLGPGWTAAELRQDNARTQASHCLLRLLLLSCSENFRACERSPRIALPRSACRETNEVGSTLVSVLATPPWFREPLGNPELPAV